MKATVEYEVEFKLSPEDVFDYCSDHSHEPEWRPTLKIAEKLTEGRVRCRPQYGMVIQGEPMVVEGVRYERPTAPGPDR